MRLGQFVFVALIGAATFSAFRSYGDDAGAGAARALLRERRVVDPAADRPGGVLTANRPLTVAVAAGSPAPAASNRRGAVGTASRDSTVTGMRGAMGLVGSRLVGRGVLGTTSETERMLAELLPRVQLLSGGARQRADSLVLRVRALDAEAAASIAQGRPVVAIRSAMKGRSLLNDIRGELLEEPT